MYSNSLFPLNLKQARITVETATLIDDIFTNMIGNKITAGLLINDISDHLPVFGIFYEMLRKAKVSETVSHKLVRHRSPEALAGLKWDLLDQSWNEIYTLPDPDMAFNTFLSIFTKLYDKHCPLKLHNINRNTAIDKPWFTNGIVNACKKKKNICIDYT